MRTLFRTLFLTVMLSLGALSTAWGATMATHYQLLTDKQGGQRFVVDISGKTNYNVFLLKNPTRLVIDLKNNQWAIPSAIHYQPEGKTALVTNIRHGIQEGVNVRIVLDLSQPVTLSPATLHPLNKGKSYRLEVAFAPVRAVPAPMVIMKPSQQVTAPPPIAHVAMRPTIPSPPKVPVIVIDPGHGGDDPGTLGRFIGIYEKDLALTYARALKAALEKQGGYKVVLTRNGDYFIPLGERVAVARKARGDLFISLHANSHPKEAMSGLSVYTVSDTASDKEAELLANEENKDDTLKTIHLSADNEEVAPILINLMQRETRNISASFAEGAIAELGKHVEMLRNTHRFAGFKVLKGVDVPAVLFELGYLSNRNEEKLLITPKHRKKIIDGLVQAINTHFGR